MSDKSLKWPKAPTFHDGVKTSDFTYDVRYNEEIRAFEFIQIDNDIKFSVPRVLYRISKTTILKFLNEMRNEDSL